MSPQAMLYWPAVLILVLAATGTSMVNNVRIYMIEQGLCRAYYSISDPEVILADGSVPEEQCKLDTIQAKVALLVGCFHISTLVPGLIAAPIYTRLASKLGTKTVLLINVCSFTLGLCYFNLVCYFYDVFNIWMIIFTNIFDFIGGGTPLRNTLLYTYIAERVNPELLSNRLYLLSTLLLGTSFLGSFLGSLAMKVNVLLPLLIGTCIFSLTILSVFCLSGQSMNQAATMTISDYTEIPQNDEIQRTTYQSANTASGSDRKPSGLCRTIFRAMTVDILLSLSPVAEALQDPLTRMTVLIFLSNDIGMAANVTFKQFVSALFHWELADVNTVSSFDLIISAAVLLGLPALSTFLVNSLSATKQQVDLWVTLGSSIAKIVGELGIGLAPSGNTCFLFLMTYAFGSGLLDGLRSFATSGLEDEKSIQRLYMAISMVQEIAGFIGAPIWTSLFYATLHGNIALPKGVHFFGAAVFFMIAFGLTLRLQRHVLRS